MVILTVFWIVAGNDYRLQYNRHNLSVMPGASAPGMTCFRYKNGADIVSAPFLLCLLGGCFCKIAGQPDHNGGSFAADQGISWPEGSAGIALDQVDSLGLFEGISGRIR